MINNEGIMPSLCNKNFHLHIMSLYSLPNMYFFIILNNSNPMSDLNIENLVPIYYMIFTCF
jgi:hypothetical protein